MNLLNRKVEDLPLVDYRQYQMDLIPELIDIILDYLILNGIEIYKDLTTIKIGDSENNSIYKYSGRYYLNKLHSVTINDQIKDPFMHLHIPKLEDNKFILNSSEYIPMIYLMDKPITFKEQSMMIYSLFSSITFDKNARRVIYEGSNIPISRFLRVFYDDDEVLDIVPSFESKMINESRDKSLYILSGLFRCDEDWQSLRHRMNNLFFDRWTSGLYRDCYGFETNDLKEIFDYVRDNIYNVRSDSFIDLANKRLIFIEQLLLPVFRATQNMMIQHLKGISMSNIIKLKVGKPGEIANYFFRFMNGSTLYESTNVYSSLTLFKASFKRPGSKTNLPRCVSSIHSSYKHIIDPVVVSNSNPGEIIALVPTTKIDKRYGLIDLGSVA